MKKVKFVPPKIFHKLFPSTIWECKTDKVLLTFDDGPNPETTPNILDTLSKHSIQAIFFCVGENVLKNSELAKRIITEGHTIANHTMSHQKINLFNQKAGCSIAQCSQTIKQTIGSNPRYFRAPYGRIGIRTEKLIRQNQLINVMWSLLTYDYKNDFNIVTFAVDNYLNKNSIIVLHDSLKSKSIIEKSIDYIVEKVKANGFEIGAPDECLK